MEKKSFLITEILCFLLGFLGVHRYYTGYIGLGILQTLTFGGCGIWALIDFIFISMGKYKDAKGQELEDYNQTIGVGALVLALASAILSTFGPKSSTPGTIINNNIGSNASVKEKVIFENAKCTVDEYGYSCSGELSEADKLKLKEIQEKLRK